MIKLKYVFSNFRFDAFIMSVSDKMLSYIWTTKSKLIISEKIIHSTFKKKEKRKRQLWYRHEISEERILVFEKKLWNWGFGTETLIAGLTLKKQAWKIRRAAAKIWTENWWRKNWILKGSSGIRASVPKPLFQDLFWKNEHEREGEQQLKYELKIDEEKIEFWKEVVE